MLAKVLPWMNRIEWTTSFQNSNALKVPPCMLNLDGFLCVIDFDDLVFWATIQSRFWNTDRKVVFSLFLVWILIANPTTCFATSMLQNGICQQTRVLNPSDFQISHSSHEHVRWDFHMPIMIEIRTARVPGSHKRSPTASVWRQWVESRAILQEGRNQDQSPKLHRLDFMLLLSFGRTREKKRYWSTQEHMEQSLLVPSNLEFRWRDGLRSDGCILRRWEERLKNLEGFQQAQNTGCNLICRHSPGVEC
jgi:hypothetical protein